VKSDSPKYERFRVFFADSVPRGLALFFGGFGLLNLVGNFRSPGFDANLWWIDLRFMPALAANALLLLTSLCLLAFAIRPPISKGRQLLTALCALAIAVFAVLNVVQFYRELASANIHSGWPVPLSVFVGLTFLSITAAAAVPKSAILYSSRFWGISIVFAGCLFVFPLLQVFCFGKTDYRRKADAIVVLGARAYADGRPSDALADRVRTACELYKDGLAAKVIFSGGPGEGDVHETEAMRRFAVQLGVKNEDIFTDEQGLNTQATVKNTEPIFKTLHARRILVVSHFYHLPRIKMSYQRDGWDVYTVPAREKYFMRETPYMVLREVAALWVYYLRPLKMGSQNDSKLVAFLDFNQ
jgi:uncharacterized SAM-binding protein YcdF (DUF218 family)